MSIRFEVIFVKLLDYFDNCRYNWAMKTNNSFDALMERFIQIVNKYNELNSIAYDYGNGIPLHPSEIHALIAIQAGDSPNITAIAEKLGITKSAVSQVVQKLSQKGLAEKFKTAGNAKEVRIRLTENAQNALKGYQSIYASIFGELMTALDSTSPEQLAYLDTFFKTLDAHFEKVIKDRRD